MCKEPLTLHVLQHLTLMFLECHIKIKLQLFIKRMARLRLSKTCPEQNHRLNKPNYYNTKEKWSKTLTSKQQQSLFMQIPYARGTEMTFYHAFRDACCFMTNVGECFKKILSKRLRNHKHWFINITHLNVCKCVSEML